MSSFIFIAFLAIIMVFCGFASLYYVIKYDLKDVEIWLIVIGCLVSMIIVNFMLEVFWAFMKFV